MKVPPSEPEVEFAEAMRKAGYELDSPPIPDGKLHRFPHEDKKGNRTGWYVLYADGIPAGSFGDWRSRRLVTWCLKKEQDFTPQEREAHSQRIEEQRRTREVEEKKNREKAAERARKIWNSAKPVGTEHPYLVKKGIKPHGIRQDTESRLIIPVLDQDGSLTSLQTIDVLGAKLFLSGAEKEAAVIQSRGAPRFCLFVKDSPRVHQSMKPQGFR